jgi:hypothetical protein
VHIQIKGKEPNIHTFAIIHTHKPGQCCQYSDWAVSQGNRGLRRVLAKARDFSVLQNVQTSSEVHQTSYSVGTTEVKWLDCKAHWIL